MMSCDKKSILVLGYFGYVTNQLDGQTVKTREMYNLLLTYAVGYKVDYFDTQSFQISKLKLFGMLKKLFSSDIIVYLPGQNSLRYIFPFVYCLVGSKKIIYPVVGGWLSEFLSGKKRLRRWIANLRVVLAESEALKSRLENKNSLSNVVVFPNFRLIDYVPEIVEHDNFRIVFFARIMKEKGVGYIFDFAEYYNNLTETEKPLSITFYGQIDKAYESYFYSCIDKYGFIEYRGAIEPDKVYDTLSHYDVLILPTFYEGEGFPGSIVDAYKSALPVIVSKWKDLPEFVEDGKTGFVFDLSDKEKLFGYILTLAENSELLLNMKKNAYVKSKMYSAALAWSILKQYL